MRTMTLPDFLTKEEIERYAALYPDRARIRDEVIFNVAREAVES